MTSPRTRLSRLSRNNIILFLILAALALLSLPFALKPHREGSYALIEIDGQEYKRVSLTEDTEFTVDTQTGTNVVKVSHHEISVDSADCPDKICVHHSPIHLSGEVIVCLPHKLVITVISDTSKESGEPQIDAVTE